MEQAKINLYRLLLFTLGVLFVLALLPKCYGSSSEIPNNSNKDTIKIYKVKIDSIKRYYKHTWYYWSNTRFKFMWYNN